jgi:exodeoxyribonuclease-1
LYDGFPGPEDEARAAMFHERPWQDRLAVVQSLEDERLRWFGLRLIYLEARSVLPERVRSEVERRLAGQLNGDGTGALTYEVALMETAKLLGGEQIPSAILLQYDKYLKDRIARVSSRS